VAAVADFLGLDLTSLMMGDSVDFQLVFTVPEGDLDRLRGVFEDEGLVFHVIGRATSDDAVVLRTTTGGLVPLPGDAWRHAPEATST
jgi:thiamine-monophosphate kinase